jgi:hypothetical protein
MHMGGEARQDGIDGFAASTGVRVCMGVDKRVRGFRTVLTRASRRKTLSGENRQGVCRRVGVHDHDMAERRATQGQDTADDSSLAGLVNAQASARCMVLSARPGSAGAHNSSQRAHDSWEKLR